VLAGAKNNDNENNNDVYGAGIMTHPLQEFTRFTEAAADCLTQPIDLVDESASTLSSPPSYTSTNAIFDIIHCQDRMIG